MAGTVILTLIDAISFPVCKMPNFRFSHIANLPYAFFGKCLHLVLEVTFPIAKLGGRNRGASASYFAPDEVIHICQWR